MREVLFIGCLCWSWLWCLPLGWGQVDTLTPRQSVSKYTRIGIEVPSIQAAFIDFVEFIVEETDSAAMSICVWPEEFLPQNNGADFPMGTRLGMFEEIFTEHPEKFEFVNGELLRLHVLKELEQLTAWEEESEKAVEGACRRLHLQENMWREKCEHGEEDPDRCGKRLSDIQARKIELGCSTSEIYQMEKFPLLVEAIHQKHAIDYFLVVRAWKPDKEIETFDSPNALELRMKVVDPQIKTVQPEQGKALLKSYCLVRSPRKKKPWQAPPPSFDQWKKEADELLRLENYAEALFLYESIQVKYRSDAELFYHMGICNYEIKNYEGAIEHLVKARILGGKVVETLSLLSLIQIKIGDYKNARKNLEALNLVTSENEESHKLWALFYSSRQNYRKTDFHLREAIKRGFQDWPWMEEEPILKGFRDESKYYLKILYLK